jgi:hypothetical protein
MMTQSSSARPIAPIPSSNLTISNLSNEFLILALLTNNDDDEDIEEEDDDDGINSIDR